MFAGITDTCGMGMILARMPWNSAETAAKRDLCEVEPHKAQGTSGEPDG